MVHSEKVGGGKMEKKMSQLADVYQRPQAARLKAVVPFQGTRGKREKGMDKGVFSGSS